MSTLFSDLGLLGLFLSRDPTLSVRLMGPGGIDGTKHHKFKNVKFKVFFWVPSEKQAYYALG